LQTGAKQKVEFVSISLLLGYNMLRNLDNFGEHLMKVNNIPPNFLKNLMWIDLQHNYLVTLPKPEKGGFAEFENLKSLYLHSNYIQDLRELEALKENTLLMTLTIHNNPVERIPHFRLLVLSLLPTLKKLDTVLFSKKEKDNAKYVPKMPGVHGMYRYEGKPIQPPPEQENNKNMKDDSALE
jgi:Leucine-rich repeat